MSHIMVNLFYNIIKLIYNNKHLFTFHNTPNKKKIHTINTTLLKITQHIPTLEKISTLQIIHIKKTKCSSFATKFLCKYQPT